LIKTSDCAEVKGGQNKYSSLSKWEEAMKKG
jgi:hypothetical protein